MLRRYIPLWVTSLITVFLVGHLFISPARVGNKEIQAKEIVEQRVISPGERTVLTLNTTGLAEVVIFEESDDGSSLEALKAGQTPRTAKVFSNVRALAYPLASQTGATFQVQIRPQAPGEMTLSYTVGTSEQAMNQLRKGQNLVRNEGIIRSKGSYFIPVYQLVPGTIIKIGIREGTGTMALLKTMDYLAVKNNETTLASLCAPDSCLQANGKETLEVKVDDYDDRYLVIQTGEGSLEFSFQVIATPEVLNYIVSCG